MRLMRWWGLSGYTSVGGACMPGVVTNAVGLGVPGGVASL
jgi:hypothetical protein